MAHHTLRWRLISFDIRDPKRYRQAIKVLKGYASRIQYSVFRSRIDDRQAERLRWELSQVLHQEDALLVLDLCPHCASRVIARNQVDDWTDATPAVHVVADHAPADASTESAKKAE